VTAPAGSAAATAALSSFSFAWAEPTGLLAFADPAVRPGSAAAQTLLLLPGTKGLRPGARYVFAVNVTHGASGARGAASLEVRMGTVPRFGSVQASPAQGGTAMSTQFALSTGGWTDAVAVLPLRFSFSLIDAAGKRQAVSEAAFAASVSTLLPEGNLTLVARAVNADGFASEATARLTVLPFPVAPATAPECVAKQLKEQVLAGAAGNAQSSLLVINAAAASLNKPVAAVTSTCSGGSPGATDDDGTLRRDLRGDLLNTIKQITGQQGQGGNPQLTGATAVQVANTLKELTAKPKETVRSQCLMPLCAVCRS
jgi:hypothetical protein